MPELKSCGFIVLRHVTGIEFLLMQHQDRWDLPKGHVDPGETEMQCALRELVEETGIEARDIEVDPAFRYEIDYTVRGKRTNQKPARKTLVIFMAWLHNEVDIKPTEHLDFRWFRWSPPHEIQQQTIDGLLAEVDRHLRSPGEDHD